MTKLSLLPLSMILLLSSLNESNVLAQDLGSENVPANEAAAIARTNQIMREFMEQRYGRSQAGEALRAVHPKVHGCVKATVTVNANLPDWAKAGVFQERAQYKAWIRFSNAHSFPQADAKGDSRGFAMKVLGVHGPRILAEDEGGYTQDFTVNSFPVFFAKDAWSYSDFIENFLVKKSFTGYIFPGANPSNWRLREALILKRSGDVKASSPLNLNYYSMAPFRHGLNPKTAVKYRVSPCEGQKKNASFDKRDENYLRHALIYKLANEEACFVFSLQKQVDSIKMPIEDPTVTWDESVSPFVPVATITIPQQTFDTPRQNEFCENLTFNPWRALPEHRPLGGINRLRLSGYILSKEIRHALNQAPDEEPPEDGTF